MLAGPLTSTSSFIRPWQVGQASTSTAKVRAKSSAQGRSPRHPLLQRGPFLRLGYEPIELTTPNEPAPSHASPNSRPPAAVVSGMGKESTMERCRRLGIAALVLFYGTPVVSHSEETFHARGAGPPPPSPLFY